MNWEQLRNHLRSVDVGREIDYFYPDSLPRKNEVSQSLMAWFDAAVLYCDLSGYTSLTNQNRNSVVARLLIGFHSTMVRVTNDCQGRVFGFAGDRVMSVISRDDIDDTIYYAMKCALGMQTSVRYLLQNEMNLRNFNVNLSCTVGVDYGPVLMGRFGAGQSTEVVAVGNAANLAAKYQAYANQNETVVSDIVYQNFPDWVNDIRWYRDRVNITDLGYQTVWKSSGYYNYDNV